MSDKKEIRYSGGIGFSEVLTIIFIVLKLLNVIEWSWVWVLAPLWISWAIFFGVLLIMGIVALIAILIAYFCE